MADGLRLGVARVWREGAGVAWIPAGLLAAVVILTMFAAEAFDPRLMWDAAARRERRMLA